MVRNITLFLLFFSSIALLKAQTYSWPCPPFNEQHWINGTFCENRTSGSIARHHFHDGVDIHLPQGNEVFAVVDGIVDGIGTAEDYGINSYVRVGRYAYVHIDPNPNLEIGQSVIAFETILGTTNSWNHLHFKDGWPGSEINPLRPDGGLDPFFDAFPPVINSTDFYVNGTTTRFLNNRVYGKVDIVALASDKTDEGPLGNNNGIYKIGYQIFDASGSIAESDLIQNLVFEQIPLSDAYITNVYFNGSDLSTYFYTTTNKISSDSYWNSDNFSKGTHRIKVLTEDTRGNTAIAWKTIQIVTPDNSAPAIPELNSLVGNSGNQWILDWQVNDSTDIAGYELSFSLDGSSWSVQKTISASLSPADSQLIYTNYPNDAVIYFRLKAYDQAAFPNYSADSDVFGVRLSAAGADVLIVDGFDRTDGYWTAQSHSFLINYGQILDELGLSFDTCSDDAVREETIQLTDYPIVIYMLGDESGIERSISSNEQDHIRQFLQNGGKLLISGSEIGHDLVLNGNESDKLFYQNYLRATFIADSSGSLAQTGVGGTVFENYHAVISPPNLSVYRSEIIEANASEPILSFADGNGSGIYFNGLFENGVSAGQLAYFSFPVELIAGERDRQGLIGRVMGLFGAVSDLPDKPELVSPNEFTLYDNYPNPFNPSTTIKYHLPSAEFVELAIFTTQGRLIDRLVYTKQAAGIHEVVWQAAGNASGVYYYRLKTGSGYSATKKLMILK